MLGSILRFSCLCTELYLQTPYLFVYFWSQGLSWGPVWPRITLNSWSFCLYPSSAGIAGVGYHVQLALFLLDDSTQWYSDFGNVFFSKVLENFQCFCLLVLCVSCSLLGGSELLWLIIVRTIVFPPMSFVVAVGFWGGLSLFIPAHNVVQAILELLPGPSISVLLTDCLTPTSLRVLFHFVLHLKQSGKNNTDLYLLIRLYL